MLDSTYCSIFLSLVLVSIHVTYTTNTSHDSELYTKYKIKFYHGFEYIIKQIARCLCDYNKMHCLNNPFLL
ncbi:hypothetical protein BD770DRAFT_393558 [Pilaira anomala]|nr:hypothetical protein BD770DRAFT_393558 [Pilaira anomala]